MANAPDKVRLTIARRLGGHWIIGLPDTISECGPYKTKAEAEPDRRGLQHFFDVEIHRKPRVAR